MGSREVPAPERKGPGSLMATVEKGRTGVLAMDTRTRTTTPSGPSSSDVRGMGGRSRRSRFSAATAASIIDQPQGET